MSVRSIVGGDLLLDNLDVTTINGSAYPPVSSVGTLSGVLLTGNSAGTTDINMNLQDILAVDNINLVTINGSAYPPTPAVPTLSQVLGSGNSAGLNGIAMNSQNITGVNNIALTTINGSAYPPVSVAGTVVTVNNTAKNITTGTPQNVSSIAVTAGTWTIDILLGLSFPSGTAFLFDCDLLHAGQMNQCKERKVIQYKLCHTDDVDKLKSLQDIYVEKNNNTCSDTIHSKLKRKFSYFFEMPINYFAYPLMIKREDPNSFVGMLQSFIPLNFYNNDVENNLKI